ncbi:MAG: histidine phosphatase family protein [Desulfobacterales bacterium]|nr:histidine phosphatase family protein [Desulfobacterales bacterium]
MDLYLVQHAEAKKEDEDPARPLSDKGVADITGVAQAALPLLHAIDTVFHSGKLRARQTAEILARHVEPAGGIRETDGLAPLERSCPVGGTVKGHGQACHPGRSYAPSRKAFPCPADGRKGTGPWRPSRWEACSASGG